MKILLCSHTGVFRGGAERSLILLAEYLSDNGIDYIINIPDNSKELIFELENRGLKYITIHKDSDKSAINKISLFSKLQKFFKRIKYIYKLYTYIQKNNIDYVYLNTLRTTSEFIATKLAGKKAVMHLRGFDTKSNFRFLLLSKMDRFIVLSNSAKKILLNKVAGYKNKNILYIPNGVTVNSYQTKIFNSKNIKIIYIGGYEHRKGVDYFFKITNKLLSLNENIQIIHLGDSNPKDDFSKKLMKNYSMLFKNKNFIEFGFSANVTTDISDADIFLMTSRIEGMPRSLLEAMERGLIPIVSNIEELLDIIDEGKNGFFIDLNNIEESIIKISNICKKITNYENISRNARNDVEKKYNIDNTNKKIFEALTIWN